MKKVYEEPSVKKVEFEFNERIAASSCSPSTQTTTTSFPLACGTVQVFED